MRDLRRGCCRGLSFFLLTCGHVFSITTAQLSFMCSNIILHKIVILEVVRVHERIGLLVEFRQIGLNILTRGFRKIRRFRWRRRRGNFLFLFRRLWRRFTLARGRRRRWGLSDRRSFTRTRRSRRGRRRRRRRRNNLFSTGRSCGALLRCLPCGLKLLTHLRRVTLFVNFLFEVTFLL